MKPFRWGRRVLALAKEILGVLFWTGLLYQVAAFARALMQSGELWPPLLSLLKVALAALASLALGRLALGKRRFWSLVRYVILYPGFLAFRLGRLLVVNQPRIVFLAVIGFLSVVNYWRALAIYASSGLAIVFLLTGDSLTTIVLAMVALAITLSLHYLHSIASAYREKPFAPVLNKVDELGAKVSEGIIPTKKGLSTKGYSSRRNQTLPYLVLMRFSGAFTDALISLRRGRRMDFFLVGSLFLSIVFTVVAFAAAYRGLHLIDIDAYSGAPLAPFWHYLALSFNILMTSDLTLLEPSSAVVIAVANFELLAALLILVFFVFLVLTAQREIVADDLDGLIIAAEGLNGALEERLREEHHISFEELEIYLSTTDSSLVSALRRLQPS